MPDLRKHCSISLSRNNGERDFKSLHRWMDAPQKEMGKYHRVERHTDNSDYRDYVRIMWGHGAIAEFLLHIALDSLQTSYKMDGKTVDSLQYKETKERATITIKFRRENESNG